MTSIYPSSQDIPHMRTFLGYMNPTMSDHMYVYAHWEHLFRDLELDNKVYQFKDVCAGTYNICNDRCNTVYYLYRTKSYFDFLSSNKNYISLTESGRSRYIPTPEVLKELIANYLKKENLPRWVITLIQDVDQSIKRFLYQAINLLKLY